MSQDRMLRQAFCALLDGDTDERDRLCDQMMRTQVDPWSNLSTETDKAMAEEVNMLGAEIAKLLYAKHPGLFSGDARDTAIATLALAETFGGVMASVYMHGGKERLDAVSKLFGDRSFASVDGILSRTIGAAS